MKFEGYRPATESFECSLEIMSDPIRIRFHCCYLCIGMTQSKKYLRMIIYGTVFRVNGSREKMRAGSLAERQHWPFMNQ